MRKIIDHAIVNHGYMSSDYFQGAGTCFTHWNDCFTGIGSNSQEAYEDAIEQLAGNSDYNHENLPETDDILNSTDNRDDYDCYFYVTVYVKGE